MATTGISPFSCSILSNDCGGTALTSTWMVFRSATERGTRIAMSREATTTVFLAVVPIVTGLAPPLDPRNMKRPRARTATIAPTMVKGLPLISAGILVPAPRVGASLGDLRETLGGCGLLVEGDGEHAVALGVEGVDDDLAGERRAAVAGDLPVPARPVDGSVAGRVCRAELAGRGGTAEGVEGADDAGAGDVDGREHGRDHRGVIDRRGDRPQARLGFGDPVVDVPDVTPGPAADTRVAGGDPVHVDVVTLGSGRVVDGDPDAVGAVGGDLSTGRRRAFAQVVRRTARRVDLISGGGDDHPPDAGRQGQPGSRRGDAEAARAVAPVLRARGCDVVVRRAAAERRLVGRPQLVADVGAAVVDAAVELVDTGRHEVAKPSGGGGVGRVNARQQDHVGTGGLDGRIAGQRAWREGGVADRGRPRGLGARGRHAGRDRVGAVVGEVARDLDAGATG